MMRSSKQEGAGKTSPTSWLKNFSGRLGLVFGGVILAAALLNTLLSAVLTGSMYPGVSVAGASVAWKTRAQVASQINSTKGAHTLTITLGSKVYALSSYELGATRDTAATVEAAYSIGRSTPWPLLGVLSSMKSGQTGLSYRLDTAKLGDFVSRVTSEIGHPPVNAKVEYINGEITAVKDEDGVSIDKTQLGNLLQDALSRGQDKSVTLVPSQVKADIVLSDTPEVIAQAQKLSKTPITLSYQSRQFTPSPQTVSSWMVFPVTKDSTGKSKISVSIDEAQVRGYVQSVANEIDVAPTNKKITIKNGVSSTDQEGADGLALNQQDVVSGILSALKEPKTLSLDLTTSPVSFKTQYNRVTTLDVGRYIEVNLSSQHLWVYQDNNVIYETPITSGATGAGFPTAQGLFSIYAKATNVWLDGHAYGAAYNYRVLVDYWMPFYAGYGLHDAWRWRTTFGGSDYWYNGSHGCVNLPLEAAAFIYNWADVGTPVWVHA